MFDDQHGRYDGQGRPDKKGVCMIVIGIDPGKTGGLAAIDSEDMKPLVLAMPLIDGVLDVVMFLTFIGNANGDFIFIEKSQAFPKMGVVPAFKFGRIYGSMIGAIEANRSSYQVVRPQEWKKDILKGYGKGKEASILYCNRKYPDLKLKKKDDGIADAICIAEYGLKQQLIDGIKERVIRTENCLKEAGRE